MQEAMYDVKSRFFVGVLGIVVEGSLGTDEDLSEKIVIEREGDAVGGCRILEVVGMELSDFSDADEVESNVLMNLFLPEAKLNEFSHGRNFDRQVRLTIEYFYATAGVLGSPVTLVFSPSFHFPTLRKTSIRSYRLRTFRFLADLLALP